MGREAVRTAVGRAILVGLTIPAHRRVEIAQPLIHQAEARGVDVRSVPARFELAGDGAGLLPQARAAIGPAQKALECRIALAVPPSLFERRHGVGEQSLASL